MAAPEIVVSCEHASNFVPGRWRRAFAHDAGVLDTHRAWDPGARVIAAELAQALGTPLHCGEVTRLLVDLNRSLDNPGLHSEFTPEGSRNVLQQRYWLPYRAAVRAGVRRGLKRGAVLHLSMHSFTPVLHGKVRDVDIGLLYDPARSNEKSFVLRLQRLLKDALPGMRIRLNKPYRGTDDGCTTALRAEFGPRYAGIEIELNQSFCAGPAAKWKAERAAIAAAISRAIGR